MHEWSRLTRRHSPRILVPCGQSEGGAFSRECRVRTGVGLASEHLSVYRGTDGSGSQSTLRWSERDSNHRSLPRKRRFLSRKANCGTERGSEKGCFVCGTDGSNPSPSSGQSVSLPLRFRRPRTWAFRAAVGGWVGAWVARDAQGASRSHQPAAYLCRAIFQYRSAAEVISENAAPVPTKSGSSRRLTCVDL